MEKTVSIRSTLRLMEDENDKFLVPVELWLLNDGVNENGGQFLELAKNKRKFVNTPILTAYVGNKIGDGHNMEEKRLPNGDIVASFLAATAERIVGFFRDEKDIRMDEKDGKKWVVGKGYLWRWYAQELTNKLQERGLQGMDVSIEALTYDGTVEDGIERYRKYDVLGTTILGDDVEPAYADANIRILSELGAKNMKKITRLAVASLKEKTEDGTEGKEKRMITKEMIHSAFPEFTVLSVKENGAIALDTNGKTVKITAEEAEESALKSESLDLSVAYEMNGEEHEIAVSVVCEQYAGKLAEATEKVCALTAELEKSTAEIERLQGELAAFAEESKNAERNALRAAIEAEIGKCEEKCGVSFDEEERESFLCDEMIDDLCKNENPEACAIDKVDSAACRKVMELAATKKAECASWGLDTKGEEAPDQPGYISAYENLKF